MNKYYIDTSIWIDIYEDRKGFNNEPLGEYALKLFAFIRKEKHKLIISDILIRELERYYSMEKINGMIKIYENLIERIITTQKQRNEAKIIGEQNNLPPGDALHSIISRDNNLILVTRDKHFKKIEFISKSYKPEELI